MATIVAVHGTFATGPEEGEGWWQRGGALERDIRELVETDDSRIDFAPHVWDGQNSETSRRAAGQALLKRLAALEQNGQKYCLIGHSHGGSVIASALLAAGGRKDALPGLSRWFTVATPFIRGRRRGLLFSRLGLLGKSAYISFLVLAAYLAVAVFSAAIQDRSADLLVRSIVVGVLTPSAFLPFILLHTLLWWRDRKRSRFFRVKDHRRAREAFYGRWARTPPPGRRGGRRVARRSQGRISDLQPSVPCRPLVCNHSDSGADHCSPRYGSDPFA